MSTAVDSIEDTTKHNGLIEATKLIDCYLEQSKDDKDREKYKDQLVHIRRYFDDRYNDVVEQNLLPASAYYRHWKFVGVELHNLNTVLTTDHSCIEIDFRKEALDETLRQIEEPSFTEAEKAVLVLVNFYSSIRQQEKMTHPSNQSVDTKSRLFDILLLSAVDDVMLQLEKKELDFSIYFSESVINRLDEKSKDPTVQVLMNVIRDVEKNYKVGVSGLIKCIRQRDTLYDQDEKMPNFFQLLHEYGQNNREYDISTFLRENNMPLLTPAEHACYYSIFSKYLIKHKQTQVMQIIRNFNVCNRDSFFKLRNLSFFVFDLVSRHIRLVKKVSNHCVSVS